MTVIKSEQTLLASVMEDPGGHLSPAVTTAIAYWPMYDSVEASKVGEGIAKCLSKGWRPTPRIVALNLEPQYKHWTMHPIFHDSLPLSCAESVALALLPHYANKRLIRAVARCYEQMLDRPEHARALAQQLQTALGDYLP